jgi:peptidoglycan/xylan/chitin deacetylase (PgdA/CDA1 family)
MAAVVRTTAVAVAACLMVGLGMGWTLVAAAPVAAAPDPGGDKPVVYFTFDDGPDRYVTGRVLDTLARYDARATFFVTGGQVNANPAVARRIVTEGHAMANHSYSHPQLTALSSAGVMDQFVSTSAAIAAVTGVDDTCYRPPYGAVNARVHEIAVQAGLPNAGWSTGAASHWGLWDVDTRDWQQGYGRTWYELSRVSAGDVVLMHSIRPFSADIFDRWMSENAHRFRFEPLPGCGGRHEPPVPVDAAKWYRYQVARLYAAYFDRRPDTEGARFWNRELASGALNLWQISDYFARSTEFQQRYSSLNNRDFVTLVYRNVMDRDPDAEGHAYWIDQLNQGQTRGEMMVNFSESDEFIARSAELVTGEAWTGDVVDSYRRGVELNVLPGPYD